MKTETGSFTSGKITPNCRGFFNPIKGTFITKVLGSTPTEQKYEV
jgi:hypothetical protein